MMSVLRSWFVYLWVIAKHKWFVLIAGWRMGVPFWRLIIHDLSKYSPVEFFAYARRFYGAADRLEEFDRAWIHHQNHNPHHWQYWIDRSGDEYSPAEMPLVFVREMIADWLAAGRAYEGEWPDVNEWTWWEKNKDRIEVRLHGDTLVVVLYQIHRLQQKAGKDA